MMESEQPKVWPKYLRRNRDGYVYDVAVNWETSRSWCAGPARDRSKHAKKEYTPVTEQDYRNQLWRDKHQYRIGHIVGHGLPYETLKQIAGIIGYDDAAESWKCK